jgi:excisionase family DNA binding protein
MEKSRLLPTTNNLPYKSKKSNRKEVKILEFLSVQDISKRLKISEYSICEWLKTGRLKGTKPGGKLWRVSESDFQEFIKSGEMKSGADSAVGE